VFIFQFAAGLGPWAIARLGARHGIAEVDLRGIKLQGPIEHHFHGGAFGENCVGTSREQHADQAGGCSGGGADACSQSGVTRGRTRQTAHGGSNSSGFSGCFDVARFVAFPLICLPLYPGFPARAHPGCPCERENRRVTPFAA